MSVAATASAGFEAVTRRTVVVTSHAARRQERNDRNHVAEEQVTEAARDSEIRRRKGEQQGSGIRLAHRERNRPRDSRQQQRQADAVMERVGEVVQPPVLGVQFAPAELHRMRQRRPSRPRTGQRRPRRTGRRGQRQCERDAKPDRAGVEQGCHAAARRIDGVEAPGDDERRGEKHPLYFVAVASPPASPASANRWRCPVRCAPQEERHRHHDQERHGDVGRAEMGVARG